MEKKYVTATNEKVSTYIHDDITFSILSKLPLKSLKRFECVRKSWSLLFENPLFMNMVRSNFLSNNHNVSLILSRGRLDEGVRVLYSLSGERFENIAKLNLPHPFQGTETLDHFEILNFGGIYDDFIFVKCFLEYNVHVNYAIRFALWNPTTDEFKVLPHSPDMFQPFAANVNSDVINFHPSPRVHGFGYDLCTYDFKVISYVSFRVPWLNPRKGYVALGDTSIERFWEISLEPFWEIYSLRSNSWRKLDVVMPTSYGNGITMGVYMNGMCHWRCIIDHFDSKRESNLVSFDLSNDVFFTTPIPMDIDGCINVYNIKCSWRNLVGLNGSIALITYQEQMATFNISILSELTVKESWIKLFIVGPLSCVERPFGVGKGKIFFTKKGEELAWFDLSTQMIEDLDVKGGDGYGCGCRIVVYKENLLPIGGINK